MSDDKVNIEIDGQSFEASKGAMLIEVADQAGIRIPRFCYHSKLSVAANCRMCLVEVERAPKPMPACATPVMDGMKVFTRSATALKAQKSVMEFLLINHPLDCPICDQGGECELQDLAMSYGRDVSRFAERKRVVADQNLGPLIATDMTRCIHCTRCVRFSEEIAGLPELGSTGRGENLKIGTFIERSVDSEMSGNVIDLCPVGALTSKPFRFRARAWEMEQYDSVSPHDSVGSNLYLHVRRNQVMRVVPRENESLNEVWLSDRDRFSYEGLYADDRLLSPAVKRDGQWVDVEWEVALAHAADALKALQAQAGGDSLGFLASAASTTEELYLLQKLARGLGSSNIDHRLREADFRDQDSAPAFPWLGSSLTGLESADAVLLVGSNPRREHPIVNHRLRKGENAGAKLMAINSVDHDFNFKLHAKTIVAPAQVAEVLERLAANAPSSDAEKSILETLQNADNALILVGPSVAGHPEAAVMRGDAVRLANATGASLGHLALGGNAAGAWLAGCVPHRKPGKSGPAGAANGRNALEMLQQPRDAYVVMGLEPEIDSIDGAAAQAAMDQAKLVVCLSAYRTESMERYADVLLPIAQFAESSGTYVNMEGEWQTVAGAVSPPGEARPAWKILRVLGNLLEIGGFDQMDSADVMAELKALTGSPEGSTPEWKGVTQGRAKTSAVGAIERIGDVPLYAVDALVRRAGALQRTQDAVFAGVELNSETANRLGVEDGARARLKQNGSELTVTVGIDQSIATGCARLVSGVPETAGFGPSFGPIEVEAAGA